MNPPDKGTRCTHCEDILFHLKSQLWFCECSIVTRISFCSPHRLRRHSGHSAGRQRTVIDDLWAEAAYCEHNAAEKDKEGEGEECYLSLSITFFCRMKVPLCHFGRLRKGKALKTQQGEEPLISFSFFLWAETGHSLVKVNICNFIVPAAFAVMFPKIV